MIILDKNVSHGNSSNILRRDRTFCKLILDPYVWNKYKEKDDWLDNYVQNNNLCSCLFIIVSAESLIDPKKMKIVKLIGENCYDFLMDKINRIWIDKRRHVCIEILKEIIFSRILQFKYVRKSCKPFKLIFFCNLKHWFLCLNKVKELLTLVCI